MLRSLTHPVLGAVGVEPQCVEAAWRAGDLGFDLTTQHAVGNRGPVADCQDLQEGAPQGQEGRRIQSIQSTQCFSVSPNHVLVEGGLALAANQREDGGGRQ